MGFRGWDSRVIASPAAGLTLLPLHTLLLTSTFAFVPKPCFPDGYAVAGLLTQAASSHAFVALQQLVALSARCASSRYVCVLSVPIWDGVQINGVASSCHPATSCLRPSHVHSHQALARLQALSLCPIHYARLHSYIPADG